LNRAIVAVARVLTHIVVLRLFRIKYLVYWVFTWLKSCSSAWATRSLWILSGRDHSLTIISRLSYHCLYSLSAFTMIIKIRGCGCICICRWLQSFM